MQFFDRIGQLTQSLATASFHLGLSNDPEFINPLIERTNQAIRELIIERDEKFLSMDEKGNTLWCEQCGEHAATNFDDHASLCDLCQLETNEEKHNGTF